MKTVNGRVLIVLLAVLFVDFQLLFAGTAGKIAGKVRDRETGEILPGVNIIVVGTATGAVTNFQGEFIILNVQAGRYTVEARMIGYQAVKKEDVLILPDFTTALSFELPPTPISGDEIIITAERPLIRHDQTMTMSVMISEEMANLPLRGFQAAGTLTAGFITANTFNAEGGNSNVYVRGGRPEELGVYIDGFQQNNLVTGIANSQIPSGAVEEMVTITGAYDAEYGRFQSAILQVTTKRGGANYSGYMEYVNDRPMAVLDKNHYFGYDVYSAGLGGPLSGNNALSFFISGEARDITDADPSVIGFPKFRLSSEGISKNDPSLADTAIFITDKQGTLTFKKGPQPKNSSGYGINSDRGMALQTKITWQAVPSVLRFDIAGNYSETYRRVGLFSRILTMDNNYRAEITNLNLGMITTYMISDRSYADFAMNYHSNDRKRMNDRFGFDLRQYQSVQGNTNSTSYYSDGLLYDIDGAAGRGPLWYQDRYVALKSSYTDQIDRRNLIRAGADFFYHTIRFFDDFDPNNIKFNSIGWRVDSNYSIIKVNHDDLENLLLGPAHPISASCFIQNQFVSEGLSIRSGIRLDFFNSGVKRVKNFSDPTGQSDVSQIGDSTRAGKLGPEDYKPSKNWYQVSPRLSLSFPISDVTQFRMSYGHFTQIPNLEFLYMGPDALERTSVNGGAFTVGNPNLRPESVTQYEIGIRRSLSNRLTIDASLYYKDINNLISYIRLASTPNSINLFYNADEGVVKGIDIMLELRRTGKFQGRLAYSLQSAVGTGNSGYTSRSSGDRKVKIYAPLAFERRHNIIATIDIRNAKGEGPVWSGQRWLENAGINFLLNAGSGLPYTRTTIGNLHIRPIFDGALTNGAINAQNMPWNFRVDAKADKTFSWSSHLSLNIYCQIHNIFDRRNVVNVFSSTGLPDDNGFLNSPYGVANLNERQRQQYQVWYNNGLFYDTARQIRFGLILNF